MKDEAPVARLDSHWPNHPVTKDGSISFRVARPH
jgi:hypothetical protein